MIFSIVFIFYILSLVVGILLLVTTRNDNFKLQKILLIVHLAFAFCLLIRLFIPSLINAEGKDPLLLLWVCSGLVDSGVIIRNSFNKFFRYYFFIFPLTIALFLLKPSALMNFLGNYTFATNHFEIKIGDNLYLESPDKNQLNQFKLIKKYGIFYKTLSKDIVLCTLPGEITVKEMDNYSITLFIQSAAGGNDTCTQNIPFKIEGSTQIERRL